MILKVLLFSSANACEFHYEEINFKKKRGIKMKSRFRSLW